MHITNYIIRALTTGCLVGDPQYISLRGRHFKGEIKIISKWTVTCNFCHFSVDNNAVRGTFKHSFR